MQQPPLTVRQDSRSQYGAWQIQCILLSTHLRPGSVAIANIEHFAKLIPESMLDMSGSVFFSGRRAFNKPSDLYILGPNPAGDAAGPHTIRKNVEAVLHEYPEDWSAWRDERWAGRRPGSNFRQRRVLYLMNQVGRGPGEVPCSEAIFLRSTDPNKIDMDSLAPLCWPFHEAVI